jgi:hypothetical protein
MMRSTPPAHQELIKNCEERLATMTSYHTSPLRLRQQRIILTLFIKILLKHLSESGETVLYQKVRILIFTCTRRHRLRDPHFSPLEDVLRRNLRRLVGEYHWQRARMLQRAYVERKYGTRRTQYQPTPMPVIQI